jgi:hypothetical protein
MMNRVFFLVVGGSADGIKGGLGEDAPGDSAAPD